MSILEVVLIMGLINAFLLILADKWHVIGWYQRNRRLWMPQAECFFCFSWWLALLETAYVGPFLFDSMPWTLIPMCACVVSSFFIKVLN